MGKIRHFIFEILNLCFINKNIAKRKLLYLNLAILCKIKKLLLADD